MNPNDEIRNQILRWFYDRNVNATSQYGKNGSAIKISDVKKGLKDGNGLRQQEVVSNLTYLIDKEWINRSEIEKTVVSEQGSGFCRALTDRLATSWVLGHCYRHSLDN